VQRARDCNWSSGLTLWDRLHGTFRLGHRDAAGVVGLAGLDATGEVRLGRMVRFPFVAEGGRRPGR
jgi:sterol desaturase/sphingolipid hydroxylase (fatty acid hydroxylase superfamily)